MNWGILSTGVIARNFAETARRMGGEVTLHAVAGNRFGENIVPFYSFFFFFLRCRVVFVLVTLDKE